MKVSENERPSVVFQIMKETNYPAGYAIGFPEPLADIEKMIAEYRETVTYLKLYGLKKSIINAKGAIEKLSKSIDIEDPAKNGRKIRYLTAKIAEYEKELAKYDIRESCPELK
jgi:hypothetical protein